ncbi:MAG: septum formation initiator family protein [Acidobacteria bacterium]|nr:septum formation initiator family protein [Acidobacteriota bacterium]
MQTSLAAKIRNQAKHHWIIAGCVLALLSLLTLELIGENGYLARRERRRQIEASTVEIEQLRQENQRLSQRIQDLRSNPHAIEELARERLRLARPGEVIVTLPSSQSPGQPAEREPLQPPQ